MAMKHSAPGMTINTHDHPAIAAAKADLTYDANDALGWPAICFFSISGQYDHADPSVGAAAGWTCHATLIGCQIGNLVLGMDDAHNALDGDVRMLERVAGDFEAERRNDEGV